MQTQPHLLVAQMRLSWLCTGSLGCDGCKLRFGLIAWAVNTSLSLSIPMEDGLCWRLPFIFLAALECIGETNRLLPCWASWLCWARSKKTHLALTPHFSCDLFSRKWLFEDSPEFLQPSQFLELLPVPKSRVFRRSFWIPLDEGWISSSKKD